jgi:methionyl-tRNA formyltransferase
VELLWVQAQGKKPMRAADWARGVRIGAGETLGA